RRSSAVARARGRWGTVGGERHHHAFDARQLGDRLLGGLAQGLKLFGAAGIDGNREIDFALVDHDLGDEAERDDVGAVIGAPDRLEGLEHALLGEAFGHDMEYVCLLCANTNRRVAYALTGGAGAQGTKQLAPAQVFSLSSISRSAARSPA